MARPRLKQLKSDLRKHDPTIGTPMKRPKDGDYTLRQRFLNTVQWRTLAASKKAYDPLCQRVGCGRPGEHVDHDVPMRDLPRSRWADYTNLVTLCKPCHGEKTAAELNARPRPFDIVPSAKHPVYG